jgi:hypothetical protein
MHNCQDFTIIARHLLTPRTVCPRHILEKNAVCMQDISTRKIQPSGIILVYFLTTKMSKDPVRCTFGALTTIVRCANCLVKGICYNKD